MKNRSKSIKRVTAFLVFMIFTVCLFCVFSSGCIIGGKKFIDYRASWVYENDDTTLIINTQGDSQFYLIGKIISDGKTTDLLIQLDYDYIGSDGKLTVYRNDGIDVYADIYWPQSNFDNFLFSASYDGYDQKLTLSNFTMPKPDGSPGFDHSNKKITLVKQEFQV